MNYYFNEILRSIHFQINIKYIQFVVILFKYVLIM